MRKRAVGRKDVADIRRHGRHEVVESLPTQDGGLPALSAGLGLRQKCNPHGSRVTFVFGDRRLKRVQRQVDPLEFYWLKFRCISKVTGQSDPC